MCVIVPCVATVTLFALFTLPVRRVIHVRDCRAPGRSDAANTRRAPPHPYIPTEMCVFRAPTFLSSSARCARTFASMPSSLTAPRGFSRRHKRRATMIDVRRHDFARLDFVARALRERGARLDVQQATVTLRCVGRQSCRDTPSLTLTRNLSCEPLYGSSCENVRLSSIHCDSRGRSAGWRPRARGHL